MLREGVATGDFHPSAGLVMRHCKHVVEKGGVETATLHILGLLKDCLANFPTQVSIVVYTPYTSRCAVEYLQLSFSQNTT